MILKTVCDKEFQIDDEHVKLFEGCTFHMTDRYVRAYWASSKYGANDQCEEYVHVYIMKQSHEHEYLVREVDHVNGDGLDNRKENLRMVTKTQQNLNRIAWGKYPQGISYDASKELYRARIQIDGHRIGLGRFKKLEDAIAARQKYDDEHGIRSGGI